MSAARTIVPGRGLAGTGVVAIWHDLLPEAKPAFYEWHAREHMPERVAIPGFRRGRRYIALEGAPEYFNLYEADTPEVLAGRDYLDRLDHPTPWTRESVAAFRNVARSICRVLYSAGSGQGGVMLTVQFDVDPARSDACADALAGSVLPPLSLRSGVSGIHLCRADQAASRIETAEKKARGQGTAVPDWALLIEGIDAAAVKAAAALARPAMEASGAAGLVQAVYRFEHQRDRSGD